MQHQMNEDFKSQNPELFDTVFEIDGKKLYADKLLLSNVSSTFESMLSDRWTSKNEAIQIESYTFEDFKEFLTFIFCGECNFTDENIFTMIDMAEFYQIPHFKELCDQYLSKMEYSLDNIFQLIDTLSKYSLTQMKKPITKFIAENFSTFANYDEFLTIDKSLLTDVIKMESWIAFKPEESFRAVFRWSEYQAKKKEEESNDKYLNMKDAIKAEITEFLPYIPFNKMELSFLNNFVSKKSFLFSPGELNDIIKFARSNVKVKVTNENGQIIYGFISRKNVEVVEVIKSLKNRESDNIFDNPIRWRTFCKRLSVPCPVKPRDCIEWYLTYDEDGEIHVTRRIYHDNLLAEMITEPDFHFISKCKIEIE